LKALEKVGIEWNQDAKFYSDSGAPKMTGLRGEWVQQINKIKIK
jgi:hypothetical protein